MSSVDYEKEMYSYVININQLESENQILKSTVNQLKTELDGLKTTPLMVCEVKDVFEKEAIIKVPNGNAFLVKYNCEAERLVPGDHVFVEQRNLNIVKKHGGNTQFDVEKFVIIEKPDLSWNDIGGLKDQIREIKEVIELPLKKPKLFKKIGIQPPKGVLLHGEPGTGKTLLAKAVAASTNSTFIEIVGSELVQKFIGEGAKLVKDLFQMAREKAPSIVFIDELDAIASQRIEVGTSGEREVQRTFMQLLAEIDGFDNLGDVKIIGCTNRKDILDSAIIRPGRLDRLIEVPLPNKQGVKEIFKVHCKNMNTKKISVDKLSNLMEGMSGAQIKSVCTESGYFAIRDKRGSVEEEDFMKAIAKVSIDEEELDSKMFG